MEKVAIILTCILLSISLLFLLRLLFHEYDKIGMLSIPRLIIFAIIHLYAICLLTCLFLIEQIYFLTKWIFYLTAPPTAIITVLQISIYLKYTKNTNYNPSFPEPLEMGYLNCYFMIYMYSIIGTFLSGLFLLLTKLIIFFHEMRIKRAIQRCIKQQQFGPQLQNLDCAICLNQFDEKNNQKILRISCSHLFHQSCLQGWLRINHTCPNCRYDIFRASREDLRGGQLVI